MKTITDKGFTLLHVLVSISLISFSSLQIMGLSKNATQTTSYMNNRVNLLDVRNILQGILKDPNACRETFQNKQLFPDRTRQYLNGAAVTVNDDTSEVLYSLGDRIGGLEFLGFSLPGYDNGTILEEIDTDADGNVDQEILLHFIHLKFKKPQSLEIGQTENTVKLVFESTIESVSGALSGNKKIIDCHLVGEEDLNPIWGEQLGDIYNRRGRRFFWGGTPNDTDSTDSDFLFAQHKVNIKSDKKEIINSDGKAFYPIPLGAHFRSDTNDCAPPPFQDNCLHNRSAIIADFGRHYGDPVKAAADGFGMQVNFNLTTSQGNANGKFARGSISYLREDNDDSTGKFAFSVSSPHPTDPAKAYFSEMVMSLHNDHIRMKKELVVEKNLKLHGRTIIHGNQQPLIKKRENLSNGEHTTPLCTTTIINEDDEPETVEITLRGCYYQADFPASQTYTVNAATNTVEVLTPKANAYPVVNGAGKNICKCEFENIQPGTGVCISYCY